MVKQFHHPSSDNNNFRGNNTHSISPQVVVEYKFDVAILLFKEWKKENQMLCFYIRSVKEEEEFPQMLYIMHHCTHLIFDWIYSKLVAYTNTKIHSNKGKQALHYVVVVAVVVVVNQINHIKQVLFPFTPHSLVFTALLCTTVDSILERGKINHDHMSDMLQLNLRFGFSD